MKNKRIVLVGLTIIILTFIGYIFVFSQNISSSDSIKINNSYVYAEIMIRWNGFGKWMSTELDLGTSQNVIDNERDKMLNKVGSIKDAVDFMNYMNDEGWEYLDKETTYLQNTSWCVYTFRKLNQ